MMLRDGAVAISADGLGFIDEDMSYGKLLLVMGL